ncbi:MAG: hypothetical protein ABI540_11050, partial [Spartobacteria bacterium]
ITLESGTVAGAPGAFLTFFGAIAFGPASAGEAEITIYGGAGLGVEARFSGDASGVTELFTWRLLADSTSAARMPPGLRSDRS